MALKKIRSIDALSGEVQFNAEPGRISGLLVEVVGNAEATKTGSREDVGRFIINRDGTQTHNRLFPVFQDVGDINAGTNLNSNTTGGATLMTCFIPFYEAGHPNALNIVKENELNIRYQPSPGQADTFTTLTVNVYARQTDLPERYQFFMLGNDLDYSAAVSRPETLPMHNISSVYLRDFSDSIEYVQFEQNGKIVVSNISFNALRAITVYDNRIEDPSFDLAQIMAHTPGVPGSTINRESVLNVTTNAAAQIGVTICAMKWRGNGEGQAAAANRR